MCQIQVDIQCFVYVVQFQVYVGCVIDVQDMFQVVYVGVGYVVVDFVVVGFEDVVDGEVFQLWYCVYWCVLYFGQCYYYGVVDIYVELDGQFIVQQQVVVVGGQVVVVVVFEFLIDD